MSDYKLELIVGPMFAGKTEELIRKARRATYAKKKVSLFKPTIDDRYAVDYIVSHNKNKISALNAKNISEIETYVQNNDVDVIAIDEIQFFEGDVVNTLQKLANDGYHIICSGLNTDFRDEPFSFIPQLMSVADEVNVISAICVICGEDATKSQRLINGNPAKYNDDVFMLGEKESYEARCRKHHVCKKDVDDGK